jgi:hypothetical protein
MAMRLELAALVLLAACSGGATPGGPDPEVDAGALDAAADAPIDAPPCSLLSEPPLETWSNGMPTGNFNVGWTCTDGWCGEQPPAMTGGSSLSIVGNSTSAAIIFRNGAGATVGFIEGAPPTGHCYRAAPDPAECRSFFDVCIGPAGLTIDRVSWQSASGHVQTWKMERR